MRDNINNQDNYKNNYIHFMDNMLPMMIIMYNQFLFTKSLNYNNEWQYTDQVALVNLLNKYEIHNKCANDNKDFYRNFSFGNLGTNEMVEIIKSGKNLHVLYYYLKMKSPKNHYSKKELEKELNENAGNYDKEYAEIIKEKITDIDLEMKKETDEMDNKNKIINDNQIKQVIDELASQFKTRINDASKSYTDRFKNNSISKFYYNIFYKLSGDKCDAGNIFNWRTYNKMWELYMSGPRLMTIDNIHLTLSFIIKSIVKQAKENPSKELYQEVQLLNKFYKNNLVNVAEDYFTLEKNNYVKREFVNICKHILHHVVTRSLYYTLVKFLYKYLKNRSEFDFSNNDHVDCTNDTNDDVSIASDTKKHVDFLNKTINELVNDNTSGKSLHDLLNACEDACYRFEERIIKVALNIYYDDESPLRYDLDHHVTKLIDIFQEILMILENNNVLPVPSLEKSKLLDYVKNNIIDYYMNYVYNPTILMMSELFEAYNKYIINEAKYLGMLEKLLEKKLFQQNKQVC